MSHCSVRPKKGLPKESSYRAVNVLKINPKEVIVVVINVDDPTFTNLANYLTPNRDWQAARDRGELPIAFGSCSWGVAELIKEICPDVANAIDAGPPNGHLFAIIMASGVSVYSVPYNEEIQHGT